MYASVLGIILFWWITLQYLCFDNFNIYLLTVDNMLFWVMIKKCCRHNIIRSSVELVDVLRKIPFVMH